MFLQPADSCCLHADSTTHHAAQKVSGQRSQPPARPPAHTCRSSPSSSSSILLAGPRMVVLLLRSTSTHRHSSGQPRTMELAMYSLPGGSPPASSSCRGATAIPNEWAAQQAQASCAANSRPCRSAPAGCSRARAAAAAAHKPNKTGVEQQHVPLPEHTCRRWRPAAAYSCLQPALTLPIAAYCCIQVLSASPAHSSTGSTWLPTPCDGKWQHHWCACTAPSAAHAAHPGALLPQTLAAAAARCHLSCLCCCW